MSLLKIFRKIRRKFEKLRYREQYSLIVKDKRSGEEVHILPPSADCIWADPFPVERNDALYVFIEQQYTGQNGTIGYIVVNPDLTCSGFHPILEKDYHLSYPNIFEHENKLYMIPESNENNRIDCYVCTEFPDQWKFCATLISGICAVDTDLIYQNGMFYLITNAAESGGSLNQKACLYYSDSFPGEVWTAHPGNPVVDSLTHSRNAGRIFAKDGTLYRPAQDCAQFYGKAVRVMQITELTPELYTETEAFTIFPPDRYNKPGFTAIGTHTYNESEHYIVTDIKTRTRRF